MKPQPNYLRKMMIMKQCALDIPKDSQYNNKMSGLYSSHKLDNNVSSKWYAISSQCETIVTK